MSKQGDAIRDAAFRARNCGSEMSGEGRMLAFAGADVLDGLAELADVLVATTEAPERPHLLVGPSAPPKVMLEFLSVPPEDKPDQPQEAVLVDPNLVASVKPSSVGSRITLLNGERIYVADRTPQVARAWMAARGKEVS